MVKSLMASLQERWAQRYSKTFLRDEERTSEHRIGDLPVLFGIDGSIICIPKRDEPNNIAIVGKKGTGKSLLMHRCGDEIFWLWSQIVIIMNDVQEECLVWNEKLENNSWIIQLQDINEVAIPLPIVFVYPHTDTLGLDYSTLKEDINFIETTIPFSEVISNSDIYLRLGDSSRYIRGLKEKLLNCEVPQDIVDLIEAKFPSKNMEGMRNKILISFDNVFDEEILNLTNKEYPYFIESSGIRGNPIVVLAKLGVVPCFETSDLCSKRYMAQVFAYHLDSIFLNKYRGKILDGETVYVLFDELTHICTDEDKNPAYRSLCKIATRGRKLGVGLIYATQNYSKIPRMIKSNTDFVFAFRHSNEEEVNKIIKDFDLKSLDKKEIMNLEDFEVLGITNEYFVCYKDGERWEESGPIKGRLIPPLSNHLKPK